MIAITDKFIAFKNLIRSKKKPYFSYNNNYLAKHCYFKDVGIYVETNLNANYPVGIIKQMLCYYDIDKNEIKIYVKK